MQIVVVGLNHRTAPLALRERLAFTASQIALQITQHIEQTVHTNASLQHSGFHFKELAWLSTCNRTELYGVMSTPQNVDTLAQFFANSHKISSSELKPHLYVLFEQHAIRHVFRVASGLDSMILGEPQILGQIKEAMRIAHAAKGLGSVLQQLFQRSFTSAKQVRSQTAINAHHISHAAITVQLAEQIFGDLQQRSVLFIGAGEMIELCATHFKARHPKQMVIANRSMAKAQKLADRPRCQRSGVSRMQSAEVDLFLPMSEGKTNYGRRLL